MFEQSVAVFLRKSEFVTLLNEIPGLKDEFLEYIMQRLSYYSRLFLSGIRDFPAKHCDRYITRSNKARNPGIFFSSKYDLTVSHDLSKRYLEHLQAPVIGFYTFGESAHSPLFEEPDKFKDIPFP